MFILCVGARDVDNDDDDDEVGADEPPGVPSSALGPFGGALPDIAVYREEEQIQARLSAWQTVISQTTVNPLLSSYHHHPFNTIFLSTAFLDWISRSTTFEILNLFFSA